MANSVSDLAASTLLWRIAAYGLFGAVLAVFSAAPAYRPLAADQALLRLSMRVSGALLEPCRELSAEELARLPPNMRAAQVCPRARAPVRIRLELDGRSIADERLNPRGLARDGAAVLYRRIPVTAGVHRVRIQVAENAHTATFEHEHSAAVTLVPGQILTIDFQPQRGGIELR